MPEYYSPYDLLHRRLEPLDARFNPSGVGPGLAYGQLLSILADYAPGIGDIKSGVDAIGAAQQGDFLGAGLAGIGVLPMIGSTKSIDDIFKSLKESAVPGWKSRTRTVPMKVDDFLSLAEKLPEPRQDSLQKLKQMIESGNNVEIPQLFIKSDGASASVVGHEGRHRAMVLKEQGIDIMPVRLESNIRWSEQADPTKFDYKEQWPSFLTGEDNRATVPFPVAREKAAASFYDLLKELLGGN